MVFDSLDKALASINTLKIQNHYSQTESKICLTKNELIKKEKELLLKTMPYINEILQKTSKEIILSFPEDRRHIVEEYERYMEQEEAKKKMIIELNEDDVSYLCSFNFDKRDDCFVDKINIENKKKLNLLQCLNVLKKK